jgi:hypothetical protein
MNRSYTQTQDEDARCDENAAIQMQRKRNFCKDTDSRGDAIKGMEERGRRYAQRNLAR